LSCVPEKVFLFSKIMRLIESVSVPEVGYRLVAMIVSA
jgi:hypothetical protein